MLDVRKIETYYGASQALFGVDLEINYGQAVALMGRNGMGKTTTIRSICGMTRARKGSIFFDEIDIRRRPSHKIARLGIGLVPEGRRCFPNLTVEENLRATARKGMWGMRPTKSLFPRLAERMNQMANSLSGGEQQMLAIGRAMMTNPKLLILDEATEGLAPVIRQEIWAAVHELKKEGQALLIVDKTLSELLKVVDHCTILERGKTVWSGKPDTLDHSIRDQYLGV